MTLNQAATLTDCLTTVLLAFKDDYAVKFLKHNCERSNSFYLDVAEIRSQLTMILNQVDEAKGKGSV